MTSDDRVTTKVYADIYQSVMSWPTICESSRLWTSVIIPVHCAGRPLHVPFRRHCLDADPISWKSLSHLKRATAPKDLSLPSSRPLRGADKRSHDIAVNKRSDSYVYHNAMASYGIALFTQIGLYSNFLKFETHSF
jgi:hypothetical protein